MNNRFVPQGSYLLTANSVSVHLYCESQKRNGQWIPAGFDLTQLNGGLVNLDGSLHVEVDAEPQKGYIPNGSYAQTSRNIKVILSAQCRKMDGSWQWSTLDITGYQQVPGEIVNDNGVLTL
ncbi:cyanovirin [Chromobacterium paludis]|uniref:Cyanovirin n=1 Tax=Chromobacterium paludis TaxID=2605945 RepID=A0A5C1DES5_9NEIS|nr:cyanovirin [Chromobacterium paludis]QEL54407.1 cyanovirin [Chromobacterium paludis]